MDFICRLWQAISFFDNNCQIYILTLSKLKLAVNLLFFLTGNLSLSTKIGKYTKDCN